MKMQISEKTYPLYAVVRHPYRTVSIAFIAAILTFAVFFTGIMTSDMQNGMENLKSRLGADLIVVPANANTDFNDILLTGNPGYFYMDKEILRQIDELDGIDRITAQFYLTSTGASCCDIPVQFIGFDPATDFVIQPWLEKSYPKELDCMQIIVGSFISIPDNGILRFYDRDCEVIGKMSETGTSLDSTIFATTETIKQLMLSSMDKGFAYLEATDPDSAISTVLIRTAKGTSPEQVRKLINKKMNGVKVIATQGMISQLSGSISSFSKVLYTFAILTILVAIVSLSALYSAISNERRKEHGLLLILGYSQKMLLKSMILEIMITSVIGTIAGLALGFLLVLPFQEAIAQELSLPFLKASIGWILSVSLISILITLIIGPMSSLRFVHALHKIDAAELMKGN